jgi:hypothetical protein
MKEKQLKIGSEELIVENKIEARFKEIKLGLLKRKTQTRIGFKRIEVESFHISDYLVLNHGTRK